MPLIEYALPLAFLLFLLVFLFALPDLRHCKTAEFGLRKSKKANPLPILALTLAYALVAFTDLGNRESPETFQDMQLGSVLVELPQEQPLSKLMIFPGVGIGEYEILCRGSSGENILSFHQDHISVLCWQELQSSSDMPVQSLEFKLLSGNCYLGEVAVYDMLGNQIPIRASRPALCDEQELVPPWMDYMNSSYFDEIYHARTAWEHLNGVWPYEISHPPLGKLLMALGIELFGMTPFGWRFMGTLMGVLMLPLMYAFLRRLFGSGLAPLLGSLVLATDFMHFTQTRIATIDSYAVFFILLMYYFLYRYLSEDHLPSLALCGLSFGLGAASKWTCLYAGAGLGLLWLGHWILRFLRAGKEKQTLFPLFAKNVLFCLVFFVLIPALIYYLSYFPYGQALGYRPFSAGYTQTVLDNQNFMFRYHAGIVSEHPYSSRWYQWIFNIRPILYYLQYFSDGSRSSIAAFLNPALCWGGLVLMVMLVFLAFARKDRVAGFIVVGWLAQLLPWVFIQRLTFEYHYFAASVFLVLAVGYAFHLLEKNCPRGKAWSIAFAGMSLLLFVLFYPALSGAMVDNRLGSAIMGWLPSWPI